MTKSESKMSIFGYLFLKCINFGLADPGHSGNLLSIDTLSLQKHLGVILVSLNRPHCGVIFPVIMDIKYLCVLLFSCRNTNYTVSGTSTHMCILQSLGDLHFTSNEKKYQIGEALWKFLLF